MITQLDTENADLNLTTAVTCLTHTPDASNPILCQAYVALGDGTKNLDESGGTFIFEVYVGGNPIQPTAIIVDAASRALLMSPVFAVPANTQVIVRVLSPNVADTDVDVTCKLYDVGVSAASVNAECDSALSDIHLDHAADANGVLISTTARDVSGNLDVNTKTITNGAITADKLGADCITNAKIADNAIAAENIAGDAITNAKIADNAIAVENLADGAITAVKIANGAIDNATFAADVGSTAYATNILALAADKAIIQNNLDHLCLTATAGVDMTTEVADNTILSRILANGDTSAFVPATDNYLNFIDSTFNVHIWFVAKTGNDSNNGHSYGTALLTIGAAVTAASAGDTIIVYPGTYEENVDASSKSLNFIGIDRFASLIAPAESFALKLNSNSTVKNLGLQALEIATDAQALYVNAKSNIVIEDCFINGGADGLWTNQCSDISVRNCIIKGKYDAFRFSLENNLIVEKCSFTSTGTYDTGAPARAATGSGQAIFNNCIFRATRNDTSSQMVCGASLTGGEIAFNSCVFYATGGSNDTGDCYGIVNQSEYNDCWITCNNCAAYTALSGAPTKAHDFGIHTGGGYLFLNNCVYTKINADAGTLTTELKPTTAGNTLDVSATGEVGLDFDNIKDASGAHTLTNITVPTVTTTNTATAVTTVNGLANNVITAASINADAITNAKIADDAIAAENIKDAAIDNATFAADVGSTAYATNIIAQAASKGVDNSLDTAVPASPTANSINERVKAVDDLTQASGGGDLTAIKAKTDLLTSESGSVPTVAEIKTELESSGSKLDYIYQNRGSGGFNG